MNPPILERAERETEVPEGEGVVVPPKWEAAVFVGEQVKRRPGTQAP